LIFGGVGAVAGLIALVYAHAAFRGGNQTSQLATDANDLAKGSNAIALDARRIAIEANDYSHRAEQRETERHDVYWEGDWVEPGIYLLVKRGDDSARNVKATVYYDGNELSQSVDSLDHDGCGLEFSFPEAVADFEREVAQRAEDKANNNVGLPFAMLDIERPHFHSVTERVEWMTPRGTPKLHVPKGSALESFSHFYPE
jgi:hypothetical protein